MRPIGRPTCVRNLFVCLITLLSPAEIVEPIEMPFRLWTLGHVNHVGPRLFPYGKGHFWRSYNLGIAYLTLTLLASWQQRCVHSLRSNLIDVAFDQLHACTRQ